MKTENQKLITHKVVEIRRVCKVGKGGKTLSFRALVVVGNQKGIVGLGIGKAGEVLNAIKKGQYRAIQNRIQISITRTKTIPHKSEARFGAAQIMLRPAAPGSGVIAGGACRAVLELAGIKNILAKQLRSKNKINNAKATLVALKNLQFITTTAKVRGLTLEELTGRKSSDQFKKESASNFNDSIRTKTSSNKDDKLTRKSKIIDGQKN
jgi:small subunit ribosomal protein S5